MKCFILILFVSGILCSENCNDDDEEYYKALDKLTPEQECSQAGGICTFAVDCPELTKESGLCPLQQRQGVECCYGISVRDTRCQKNGGHCIPAIETCGPEFKGATDCPDDHKCCILV